MVEEIRLTLTTSELPFLTKFLEALELSRQDHPQGVSVALREQAILRRLHLNSEMNRETHIFYRWINQILDDALAMGAEYFERLAVEIRVLKQRVASPAEVARRWLEKQADYKSVVLLIQGRTNCLDYGRLAELLMCRLTPENN